MFGTTASSYKHPDITKARHKENPTLLGIGDSASGIFFKEDGTRLFVIDDSANKVIAFDLNTAWDLTNATEVATLSVSSTSFSGRDIHFKPDGTKMFIAHDSGTTAAIHEYALSSAWDITTASYTTSTNVSVGESNVQGLFFKSDGTRFYYCGSAKDHVYQEDLATAWDVSSTNTAAGSFSVSSQDTDPEAIWISSDGTKMFIAGNSGNRVIRYDLSTAWDVTSASYTSATGSLSSSGVTLPTGLFFKPDGTKMFLSDSFYDWVRPFTLSSAFDLSTDALIRPPVDFLNVLAQATSPSDLHFKPDGTKLFIIGRSGDAVDQYDLSTPWAVNTATHDGLFSVAAQENSPRGLTMNPEGTKFFVTGDAGEDIVEYAMSTAFDVTTASYTAATSRLKDSSGVNLVRTEGVVFSYDGTKVYICSSKTPEKVFQYSFSTGYDVSTLISLNADAEVTVSQESMMQGIDVSEDGSRLYVVGGQGDDLNQFSMSTPHDLSTLSFVGVSPFGAINSMSRNTEGCYVRKDQQKFFIVDRSTIDDSVAGYLMVS